MTSVIYFVKVKETLSQLTVYSFTQSVFFALDMEAEEQEINSAVYKDNINLQTESAEITNSRAASADLKDSQAASSDMPTTAVKSHRTKSEFNEAGVKSKSPLTIQYFSGNPMVEETKGILHIFKEK